MTAEDTNVASNFPPPPTSLFDNLPTLCKVPSTTFADLVDYIMKDIENGEYASVVLKNCSSICFY